MKIISEANQYVVTEYGAYRLSYELQEFRADEEEGFKFYYGIRICQVDSRDESVFDLCQVRGVTDREQTARALFAMLVEGLVMPVSLPELIDDWQASVQMV